MLTLVELALKSRTVVAVISVAAVLGGLLVWHKVDKSSAVRRAVVEYVAKVELTSARVQMEELKRRKLVAERVSRQFRTLIEQANADAEAATKELEKYASTVGADCVVQPDLIERLRNR
ncbi:hypothetical protein [Roseibium sp.]|uniref:hypothetical protein n=1 Tax=Roseibium sp. TaxID=1936156 RepID=UPI003BA87889